ncbi:polysaccharide biosynthesis/export family protein [Hydrocarboniphaga sp.]|uniref:polysaccharide biosynthesis/export family protein n=1 Tax=Hydrocarboniphaga sp. TaxID=2033016 RepID=UPI003D0A3DDD
MRNHLILRSLATLLITAPALTGCVGMNAPYHDGTIKPVEIDLIPVTPDVIAQQAVEHATLNAESISQLDPYVGDYRYLIRPGDVLTISVPSIVSFNSVGGGPSVLGEQGQGYAVYNDGTIYLPYSGSVQVAGLSLKETQEAVVKALSGYLKQPQVVVSVQEFRSQRIMVTGQVQRPGYLPVTDVPITLIGALSTVGGITEMRGDSDPRVVGTQSGQIQAAVASPDLRHVILKRGGNTHEINVQKVLASGDVKRDPLLIDGDVVVVPTVHRSNVFVLGEVTRPGLLEVNRDDTDLADALMASGGINQLTANASRVYVIRGDYKRPTVYQVDAGRPDAMLLAQKFQILPSDVIYVAEARATRWNRGLSQILPTVQGLLSAAVVANTVDNLSNN